MPTSVAITLKPVVHFREFPFGTTADPSMREFMDSKPSQHQTNVLQYLRSGHILAIPMGADLPDWLDRDSRANPLIDDRRVGGVTPMTDGVWFWPAALIYFVERYNVRLPEEFLDYAAGNAWAVDKEAVSQKGYDYDY